MKHAELDEIDIHILNILQREARRSLKEIAAEVNLSSPAVSVRIRRMEDAGLGINVSPDGGFSINRKRATIIRRIREFPDAPSF